MRGVNVKINLFVVPELGKTIGSAERLPGILEGISDGAETVWGLAKVMN